METLFRNNKSRTIIDLFKPYSNTELNEVFKLWQDAFEWSYYDEVLSGISHDKKKPTSTKTQTSFQALFCIDERECSLRRHIEHIDPNCETFGTPGFFGVEFYFQPQDGNFTINFVLLLLLLNI